MTKEVSRLARLEHLKASIYDCIAEGLNLGDMLLRVDEEIRKEREAVRWSGVFIIANGYSQKCIYEGTEINCSIYTRDHKELQGNCIISPLY